jgi:hypothetical protein
MVTLPFYIVPMHNLVLWKMRLETRYSVSHLWWFVFTRERNKRCIVLFTIGYQSKDEEALMRVINYPARYWKYDD